jgi:hypothetical protein
MAARHLTTQKYLAIGPLSGLSKFEIAAHNNYVVLLNQQSVSTIRAAKLLIDENSQLYGRCHRLAFHPQVAAQIFRAFIRQKDCRDAVGNRLNGPCD